MRLTIKQKQAINDRYPESHLVRVGDGWFLIARAGKEDSEGWPMGWYIRQIIDVEGPNIWLMIVADGLKTKKAAIAAAAAEL